MSQIFPNSQISVKFIVRVPETHLINQNINCHCERLQHIQCDNNQACQVHGEIEKSIAIFHRTILISKPQLFHSEYL